MEGHDELTVTPVGRIEEILPAASIKPPPTAPPAERDEP